MFLESKNRIVLPLDYACFVEKKLRVLIQLDESENDDCSGNKWWKLKYNLLHALEQNYKTVLTFGGAFSNHIVATAFACKQMGLGSIGIIRGEELNELNPSLLKAISYGMKLVFINRSDYKNKNSIDWFSRFGSCYVIPEGGTNDLAVKGCKEFLVTNEFDYVCCSVGTGGTIAGIINSLNKNQFAIGFSALKNAHFLSMEIEKYVCTKNWNLNHDFHFNGYAKINKELIDFINAFKRKNNISLDPVYTSKLAYGVFSLIDQNYFKKDSTILIVHSGGLQGIEGMNHKIKSKQWHIE